MAIAPTGAIYKALSFDNTSSRNYGVYITGEAVYNAPERDVEMITIPGRNGAYALDKGRFQNIEVKYPAGIFADTEADFRQAISDFRNFLCSKKGYCRLSDDYNPNEYRMAVYKSGLEVDPAQLRAGEFEITFECKPQRWLTSGETKVTIAQSGDTITNPTLFESSPLLEVEGYGTIGFNGHEIELLDATLGEIELFEQTTYAPSAAATYSITPVVFNSALVNNGDSITLNSLRASSYWGSFLASGSVQIDSAYAFDTSPTPTPTLTNMVHAGYAFSGTAGSFQGVLSPITFVKGTASSVTGSCSINKAIKNSSQVEVETLQVSVAVTVSYDGDDTITATITQSFSNDTLGICSFAARASGVQKISNVMATSTVSLLGTPTYLDCDLGEAYKYEGGEIVSLNAYIDLGSELPTLASGSNAITFDNTVTSLKIQPRWWKV